MANIGIRSRASKNKLCELCEKDGCTVSNIGMRFCIRSRGDVYGYKYLGETTDGQFGKYFKQTEREAGYRYYRPNHGVACHQNRLMEKKEKTADEAPTTRQPGDENKYELLHDQFTTNHETAISHLAQQLGVLASALHAIGFGWNTTPDETPTCARPDPQYMTLQKNEFGTAIGFKVRLANGTKFHLANSAVGLSYPDNWQEYQGPILAPEGASDAAALLSLNLSAIARPSNNGRADMLADLTAPAIWGDFRDLIILGDNDKKDANGRQPGKDGAVSTAQRIANKIGTAVFYALPPEGYKDWRTWLNQNCQDIHDPAERLELRARILAHITNTAVEVHPTCEECRKHWAARLLEKFQDDVDDAVEQGEDFSSSERKTAYCHRSVLMQSQKDIHMHRWVITRCGCWNCQGCRKVLEGVWEAHFEEVVNRESVRDNLYVWRGHLASWKTVNMRIRRAGGESFRVHINDDRLVVFTTAPIPNAELTTPSEAVETLRETFKDIGDYRRPISTSRPWKLPKKNDDEGAGQFKRVGHMNGMATGQAVAETKAAGGTNIKVIPKGSGRIERYVDFWFPSHWDAAQVIAAHKQLLRTDPDKMKPRDRCRRPQAVEV